MTSNPFRIANPAVPGGASPTETPGGETADPPINRVQAMVASAPVFLFMKGMPSAPRCGFSANAVGALDALGVSYTSFDILSDEGIRQAAKDYAQWPTFPQLWVNGELVGGHDIMMEMYQSGELEPLLREAAS
jgi:monothiol glutaredoxin